MPWEDILEIIWNTMPVLETVIAGMLLSGFMSLVTWVKPAVNNKNLAAIYRIIAVGMGVVFTLLLIQLDTYISGNVPDIQEAGIKFFFIFLFSELFYRKVGIKYINRMFK